MLKPGVLTTLRLLFAFVGVKRAIEILRQLTFSIQATSLQVDRLEKVVERTPMKPVLVLLMLAISATAQMSKSGLLKLDDEFAKATSEKLLDRCVSFMMDSTVLFGPPYYSELIVGREEIRNYYRKMFSSPGFKMNATPRVAEVLPSGQTGYTRGTFHWVIPNDKCHCINDWHGTYLAVWEEESPKGKWKLKALFPSTEDGSLGCGCGS